DTPIALISLVDKDRQWFKSALGIAIKQTDLDISMCKYAVSETRPLIVEDASKDPRFCDYPSVKGDPHIRFYAGIPLISPRGYSLGTLCVIDHKPRQLDGKQLEALQTIADQVVLQMELRREQNDLQSSLALQYGLSSELGQVLDSALDMICTMDAQGCFQQISANSSRILGYEPKELLGKSYLDLVVPDDRPKTIEMASNILSGLFTREFENRYITKSGNIVHMMWSAIWSKEANLFFCVARDITARKHQEEFGTNQAKVLEQIAVGASSNEVFEQISHLLEGQIDGCVCSIMLLDKEGKHLSGAAGPNLPAAYMEKIEGLEVGPSVGSCGTAVFLRQNVFVEDIQTDPLWAYFKDIAAEHKLRACWSIPFYSGSDKVLGTFAVYFHSPRKPQPEELKLLAACSHLA
ncbi:MAG: GAF domain-containing protein, partial [Nitrosomonadales bacterium]|nr:GAF domain-containing protein [Nitrosomonadales bacterium]